MSRIDASVYALGEFAANLRWEEVPLNVRQRVGLIMLDTLGVTMAGASTPEVIALRDSWSPGEGPVSIIGAGRSSSAHDAMWLNGVAACCLELDEGNKYATGHPAAHVLFAALANAQTRCTAGTDVMLAFLVGYEIASRFGRAMRRTPGLHTHGHWGGLGAAAAVARLRGADAVGIASAIDAAAGLVLASPWESALRGSYIRNTWIGAANVAGTVAAHITLANLSSVDGTPELTLGGLLGDLIPAPLTQDLGRRFDVCSGYFKQHPSCSYTHPPIDAIIALRAEGGVDPERVADVLVETSSLAAPLTRTELPTRLAAMFSIPYTVAIALTDGHPLPASFDRWRRTDPRIVELMGKVRVLRTDEMDCRLPEERAARVTLTMDDGREASCEVPNAVGDADYQPFDRLQLIQKSERLLGADKVWLLVNTVDAIVDCDDISPLIASLG